ncbi:hypothetical protein [Belnapia rosea]|uniref:hypothetical protein n=1 Tax=Belnapia rosea TaxID=938405 RepID=UPI00089209C6|nr:hypothetical protein [Belnapia rosea]SDB20600.1 hypothetical protein SAMN02927895_00812 [Belnapia rosea]
MLMHWVRPLLTGCAIGAAAVAIGWFLPSVGLEGSAAGMLQPNYQLPELIDRFVPEVLTGLQMAFVTAAASALCLFIVFALVTRLVARPTGPGEVGRGWRVALWWVLLLACAGAAYGAVAYFLSSQVATVDAAVATRIALLVMIVAAATFWVMSVVGVERMMRPAVFLASMR